MISKGQTGMQGVYLVAAELTRLGLIVSIISRNARGVDLLATGSSYKQAWSIQVKTSWKPVANWPIGERYKEETSASHIYVFVNLRGEQKPDYYVIPSTIVAKEGRTYERPKGRRYGFARGKHKPNDWSIFGVLRSN